MTVIERIADISKKSGISHEVVRQVLKASRDSLIETLQKGEKSTLPGITTYKAVNCKKGIAIRCKASNTILHNVNRVSEVQETYPDEFVDILQIPGLM